MNTPKEHVKKVMDTGIRFDNRKLDEYRPIKVDVNVSKNAEGSAQAKIGDTEVIVGVKLSIEKPYPDKTDEGTMMVGTELLPLSSPEFESGPPGEQSIELARVVDRGIRESKTIDVKKLCIEKGEKVWMVAIDICTLNDAGNLFDASSLAAIAAIKNTKFPKLDCDKIDYKEHTKQGLPLSVLPISVTILKIGNNFIVDPLSEEEAVADARLTVASVEGKICALQKGGEAALSIADIDKMTELALKKSKELSKYI